jgi:acetyltransferase-like isoleucine patch superfamily enzyme
VWVGPNVSIKEHLNIGARAMVGIGSVVIRDVDADTTVAGNPARVINAEAGVRADA